MAKLVVRYVSGEEDEWELREDFNITWLWNKLRDFTGVIGFAVEASEGGSAHYDLVGLNLAHVAGWHIDGLLDVPSAAALWAEMQPPTEENPS